MKDRFPNLSIKIKTSILTVFIFILLSVVSTLLFINHKSNTDFAFLTTQKIFDRLSDQVVNQISQYDFLSSNFINLSNKIQGIDNKLLLNTQPTILPVFIEHILNSNYVYGIYIGFSNDEFYQVINLNVSSDINSILDLTENGRWLIRKHLNVEGKIIRYEQLLDENLEQLSAKQLEVDYKPTQRPWYKKALEHHNIIKTDPYIFSSLKQPGVTYGKVINNTNGSVLALDISLSKLTELLSKQHLVKGSGAFIFKQDGQLIGQFDQIIKGKKENIGEKYPNLFIKDGKVVDLEKQELIEINKVTYIKYTTLLKSNFEANEYLAILSPLDTIMKPYKDKIYTILQTTIVLILVFILPMLFYAVQLIVKPILRLQQENEKIKNNNFDDVKPVNSFMLEISELSNSMVTMASSIKEHQENLEDKIEKRTKEIETLLNNAGQGFLSFNKSMTIGSKYSKEAQQIFGKNIEDLNITHLLYDTKEEQSFLESTLQNILIEDEMKQEIFISLLQKEFMINGSFVEVEYKVLNNNNFMMILTDVTDKKELAKKIKKEQQVLKMAVETVTTLEQFIELKEDYDKFISNIQEYKSLEKLSSLRKLIHTYKGLFAQKEMLFITEHLHSFESDIDQSLKKGTLVQSIENITTNEMSNWLEEDISLLKEILGKNFFNNQNTISINKSRIINLQKRLERILQEQQFTLERVLFSDIKNIANGIESLTYNDIKIVLKPYEKLVEQLANKLGKYINPLKLDCDNIYLSKKYKPFLNSLVHIFRNSVDYGIEDLETRYEKEKSEFGTITCSVKEKNNMIKIKISDDGAGVDLQKIKNLALKKEIFTQQQLDSFDEQQILMILFEESFSTSDTITDISGRGVGLASVLYELQQLKGTVKVKNSFGKGIGFSFSLPYEGLRYG
jgi:two-component system chemotaxis sensor kinase CheA